MSSPSTPTVLVIEGNEASSQYKETVALLDRSGLAYRIGPGIASGRGDAPRLRAGEETLTDLSKEKVVDFLWAHGARFEDS